MRLMFLSIVYMSTLLFAADVNIYFDNIGNTQKKYFEIQEEMKIDVNVLFNLNNQWYNNF